MDQVLDYLQTQIDLFPQTKPLLTSMKDHLSQRLYYQYSQSLLQMIKIQFFLEKSCLKEFYTNAVLPIDIMLDPDIYAKFVSCVTDFIGDAAEKKEILEKTKQVVKEHPKAMFITSLAEFKADKNNLSSYQTDLNIKALKDTLISGNFGSYEFEMFYSIEMNILKERGEYTEFYNSAMSFIKYANLEELHIKDRTILLEDIFSSALVNNIYSLGPLINCEFIKKNSEIQFGFWIKIVKAVCDGNVGQIDKIIQNETSLDKRTENFIKTNQKRIIKKTREIAFILLCNEALKERQNIIPMESVESNCSLDLNAAENLIIEIICKGIVKGRMDQLNKTFRLDFIVPQELYGCNIASLQNCTQNWSQKLVDPDNF